MVFSPGLMESAPQTNIATVRVPAEEEGGLMNRVAAKYPNISAIRVKDALATALDLLTQVGGAIRGTALATLGAGILVLAGAVAAGREKRIYEAVLLKMLGGRRRDIAFGYLWEFSLLALVSGALAVMLGSFGAWLFLKLKLETQLGDRAVGGRGRPRPGAGARPGARLLGLLARPRRQGGAVPAQRIGPLHL